MPKTQEELLSILKGQTVVIPHLGDLFRTWPSAVNPERAALTVAVNKWLESLFPEQAAALRKADFTLFACCWWPNVELSRLRIVAYLEIWLFLWDDEIDQTSGSLSGSPEKAQAFRMATIDAVTYYLGLGDEPSGLRAQGNLIKSFSDIGEALRVHYTLAQRQHFLDEMKFFLRESRAEQEVRLAGKLETVEQYWRCRLGTSAVGICLAVIEYANNIQLPPYIWDEVEAQIVWQQVIVNIVIVNDLISLRKEMAQGCVNSLIPINCNAFSCTAQDAVDRACDDLRIAIEQFDVAATKMMAKSSVWEETSQKRSMQQFLQSARMYCTGNHTWSLETGRYALMEASRALPDGIGFTL